MKYLILIIVLNITMTTQAQDVFDASREGNIERVKELYLQDSDTINAVDSKIGRASCRERV